MGVIDGFLSGLKELVSVIETRSIAETTAANTRVDDLITAVEALTVGAGTIVVEAPNVTVRPNITVNCGCGGAGGSVAPQAPGEEGGTPPPGTSEPDEIDERKCKAACILVQDLIAYTDGMSTLGLFNWTMDYSTLGSILNGSMAQFSDGLLGIVAQTGGFLTAIQNFVFGGTFTADIPTVLSSNQEEMVCALYNAQNVTDAKSEALAASGLTGFDANWVDTILTTNALNMLFFAAGESESIIAAYAGTANCAECAEDWYLVHGGYSNSYAENLLNVEISSFSVSNYYTADIMYYAPDYDMNSYGKVISITLDGYTSFGSGINYSDSSGGWHSNSSIEVIISQESVRLFDANSSTPFTMTVSHEPVTI